MLTYEKVKGKDSQFQSLVGMSVAEFEWLHNDYERKWKEYIAHFTISGEVRTRPHRIRKDRKLEKTTDQLLFILQYLKSNALQEHHAAAYGMTQAQANLWIHLLLELLHRTLKDLGHLPQRRASQLKALLWRVEEIFVDGTERDLQRPGDADEQRAHYSGKKSAQSEEQRDCHRKRTGVVFKPHLRRAHPR